MGVFLWISGVRPGRCENTSALLQAGLECAIVNGRGSRRPQIQVFPPQRLLCRVHEVSTWCRICIIV